MTHEYPPFEPPQWQAGAQGATAASTNVRWRLQADQRLGDLLRACIDLPVELPADRMVRGTVLAVVGQDLAVGHDREPALGMGDHVVVRALGQAAHARGPPSGP